MLDGWMLDDWMLDDWMSDGWMLDDWMLDDWMLDGWMLDDWMLDDWMLDGWMLDDWIMDGNASIQFIQNAITRSSNHPFIQYHDTRSIIVEMASPAPASMVRLPTARSRRSSSVSR